MQNLFRVAAYSSIVYLLLHGVTTNCLATEVTQVDDTCTLLQVYSSELERRPSQAVISNRVLDNSHTELHDELSKSARKGIEEERELQLAEIRSKEVVSDDPETPEFAPSAPEAEASVGNWTVTTTSTLASLEDLSSTTTTMNEVIANLSTTKIAPYSNLSTTPDVPTVVPAVESSMNEEEKAEAEKDCEVSEWTDWSDCGLWPHQGLLGAWQTRNRIIITPRQPGGHACPVLNEMADCEEKGTQNPMPQSR